MTECHKESRKIAFRFSYHSRDFSKIIHIDHAIENCLSSLELL